MYISFLMMGILGKTGKVNISTKIFARNHTSFISGKIEKSVGIFYNSRYFLSTSTKLSLYYTLIYPYHYQKVLSVL